MFILSDSQEERLRLLQEECAEVIKDASKVCRFGYENFPPGEKIIDNKHSLQIEIGNVMAILDMMYEAGDILEDEVLQAAENKRQTIHNFTKHQKEFQ